MQKITPYLWFEDQAEEAARFYTSIFKNSKVDEISRYGEGGPAPAGSVMLVSFELDGQQFIALNGGPQFQFTEAISFVINCESQEEVDYMWARLTEGGEESMCGWLKDRYGVSWQVVPTALPELLNAPDPEAQQRVMEVFLKMKKIDLPTLRLAYKGR